MLFEFNLYRYIADPSIEPAAAAHQQQQQSMLALNTRWGCVQAEFS
jgi:hypothetical protein